MADALAAGQPDPRTLPTDEATEAFRARGVDLMFAEIKQSLHDFGVDFDVYFHEDSLHESGAVDAGRRTAARARARIYEADGATWLRTTDFGDDKDRVDHQVGTARRRTSPATSPTTWTSGSAASTASSSCSAPTTTATSAA